MSRYTIAVIGNPNAGKTTLFNDLTGARQHTGNWPGVTVEKKEGHFKLGEDDCLLVDLPGTYSLDSESPSLDEKVARDYIESKQADLLINIVDASNLERSLYLTAQLLEMGIPMVVALNMMDVAENLGYSVDTQRLADALEVPVVAIVATRKSGVQNLLETLRGTLNAGIDGQSAPAYPPEIESALAELKQQQGPVLSRWDLLQQLSGRTSTSSPRLEELRSQVESSLGEDADLLIADGRYRFAHGNACASLVKQQSLAEKYSDDIDHWVLHRWFGVPIFLFVMYLMFTFTINIGGAFIDFFDIATGAILVDGVGNIMNSLGSPDWLRVMVADGIGGGIQVVATFIPIIGFLYLFLSVLEDSGYMARAAFVMDRLMQKLGLPGKAFVPLIVGFGCNVPSIMAARTLDAHRERIMTVMMAPFMSCGARLSVYALFAAIFFPVGGQNIVFLLYIAGIIAAMLTAWMLKSTLLKGEPESFLMELPTYQVPNLRGVLTHTWNKLKGFINDAGKIIVVMVVVINVLNSWGTDGSFGNEDSNDSMLSAVGQTLTPAFSPMGIQEDNWPATVGIFTGILAKEVVVGTLDAIYSQLDGPSSSSDEEEGSIIDSLGEAFASIPANLGDALTLLADPLGLGIMEEGLEGLDVQDKTFSAMASRFDGAAGAFAYLLFILLYFPCVASTAAIKRETNWSWMFFAISWTTALAYFSSATFYQLATWSQHPTSSALWLLGFVAFLAFVYWILRTMAQRSDGDAPLVSTRS